MAAIATDELGALPEAFMAIVRRHALPEQFAAFDGCVARYLAPGAAQEVPHGRRRETLFNLLAAAFDAGQIVSMWRDWEEHRATRAEPPATPAVARATGGGPLAIALGTAVLGGLVVARGRRR